MAGADEGGDGRPRPLEARANREVEMTDEDRLTSERAVAAIVVDIAEALDTYDERRLGEYLRYARWRLEPVGTEFSGTHGAEELSNRFVKHHGGVPSTQHDVTNVLVDVEGDGARARARSEFAVLQAVDGLPLQFILAGHYDDTFEHRAGGWCLVERVEHWDLVGDISRHIAALPSEMGARRG
jgi:hypothetical protein